MKSVLLSEDELPKPSGNEDYPPPNSGILIENKLKMKEKEVTNNAKPVVLSPYDVGNIEKEKNEAVTAISLVSPNDIRRTNN